MQRETMQALIRAPIKAIGFNQSNSAEKPFQQKTKRSAAVNSAQRSNQFLVVHIAYAALIVFLAGAITLLEVARYVPDKPLYEQGMILLPYFAGLGWGVGRGGEIVNTFPFIAIGAIDLVSAAVLAAGAYFHRQKIPPSLEDASTPADRYHATWDNPRKLGRILGTHLIFWGIGAALFAAKAMFLGGIYDANLHEVRAVTEPTLDFGTIASYRSRLFYVDNLEDLVGGHLYIAAILIAGGIWHILVEPWQWVKERFIFNGEGILAYSLFGMALGGFAASYFCGFNSVAHPIEFYGPTLQLKSSLLPHYLNPIAGRATSRTLLANGFFYAAFVCFVGSFWVLARASGFRFANVQQTWKQAAAEVSPFPVLSYQKPFHADPHSDRNIWYETPRAESNPALHKQLYPHQVYEASRTAKSPAVTYGKAVQNTLYEVTYHPKRSVFYHSAPIHTAPTHTAPTHTAPIHTASTHTASTHSAPNSSPIANSGSGDRSAAGFQYEPPKANHRSSDFAKPAQSRNGNGARSASFYGTRAAKPKTNFGSESGEQVCSVENANPETSPEIAPETSPEITPETSPEAGGDR